MDLSILVSGTLWLLPAGVGAALVIWGVLLFFIARRWDWTRRRRMHQLRIGRSIIPVLPMLGILGTVWGLMDTLLFMRNKTGGNFDIAGVVDRFGVALNTTFWGIIFSVLAIVIYEFQLGQLEATDEDAEE